MTDQFRVKLVALSLLPCALALVRPTPPGRVSVTSRPTDRRVDISIDGQPFTSYIYPQSLEKPVLYPIRTAATGGDTSGELSINADWVIADGSVLLREQTRFIFAGGPGTRTIDRTTTWTAADKALTFNDTKEGAFGIRVARSLDSPTQQRDAFVGADGKRGAPQPDDNKGVTGRYIGSDRKTGNVELPVSRC